MDMGTLTILLCLGGTVVTGILAFTFWRDPEAGMKSATHRLEQLPQVMTDRYVAFVFLSLAAAWHGDAGVIAVLFTAFAFMGFADGVIYARAGHPHIKHTAAGVAAALVAAVAAWTELSNGAV
ncbi:hypothetical protein BXY66_1919 [Shimia isoporae]|uniref:Uncharacterized protein n=1 Tax=Shimia isoporae TaxID=647720 RepID=A0A4R1NNC4_9RHOB|nr:hypothetical protein [Shimia isoporae]TCL09854.1 hypothetical protein BXY66_1919 [Shimia isoporae]